MGLLAYLPHLLYSTALTSISMHHLAQRKAAEADRAHVAAQISILEDLLARPTLQDAEFQRLWRLARAHDVWAAREQQAAAAGEGGADGKGGGKGKGEEERGKNKEDSRGEGGKGKWGRTSKKRRGE